MIELTNDERGLLDLEIQDGIDSGFLEIAPRGQWWGVKPVVRRADNKKMVKGSGKYKGSKDPVEVGKETAFRNSKGYRSAVELLISADNPNAKYTFEQLIDTLWDAVNGVPYRIECPHPESCDNNGFHMLGRKTDTATAFKLFENLAGKATETKEIRTEESKLHVLLEQREFRIVTHGVPEEEAEERKLRVLEMLGEN